MYGANRPAALMIDVDYDVDDGYEPSDEDIDWMIRRDDWFRSLPPERRAAELNYGAWQAGAATTYVAVGDQVVDEGGRMHRLLVARQTVLDSKRSRVVGIRRPIARVRRGRSRRSSNGRRPSRSRSPGRKSDPDPSRRRRDDAGVAA
jgi:hypothetical protein